MNRFGGKIKVFTLLILLLALSASPIIIMRIENNKTINKVVRIPLQEDDRKAEKLSIEKKLDILSFAVKSKEFTNQIIEVTEDDQNIDLLKEDVQKQLSTLSELNVIPSLDYSGNCSLENSSKMLVFDKINPKNIVSVKECFLNYDGFMVDVLIDADTSVLYSILVISEKPNFFDNGETFSPIMFISYLGLSKENAYINGDESYGICFYKNGTEKFDYNYCIGPNQIYILL